MMNDISKAADWLKEQVDKVSYGSVSLTVTRHIGKTTRIEKTIIVKEQTDESD